MDTYTRLHQIRIHDLLAHPHSLSPASFTWRILLFGLMCDALLRAAILFAR